MQKRSFPVELVHVPVELKAQLPIIGGDPYEQLDRPITVLHRHDCLELGYCYSGSGVFVVGEKVQPFNAGDVSFINHTEVHLARSAPGTSSHWTWVYVDPIRLVNLAGVDAAQLDPTRLAGPDFNNILPATKHPQVGRIVLRLVEELRGREKSRAAALRALVWELMVLMQRLAPTTSNAAPHQDYDRLAPALQFLAHRYMDPIDVKRLARRCGLSEVHFRRLFIATIGRPPRAYWHDLRMRMAASLLRTTSRSVLDVSVSVGFDTLSSFNRVFRSTFDTTPREWRKGNA